MNRTRLCIALIIDDVDQALLKGAVFWFQMSNIFGARLNHTAVDKTHLAAQLLSSCALLLHVRNKFTDTLQWSLHWRLASRKHASCCQDRLMRNQCTHEQISLLQFTCFSVCWCPSHLRDLINALNLWACVTHVFTNQSSNQRKSSLRETSTWPKADAHLRVIQSKWRLQR